MAQKITRVCCGMDEAGRGSLAGPMVLAAVVLKKNFEFKDIAPNIVMKDSKQMTNIQREKAFQLIKKLAIQIKVEIMSVDEIDKTGVGKANIEGFRRLINKINSDEYIVDGTLHLGDLGEKTKLTKCVIDADEKIPATMASGIVAKYLRDKIMLKLYDQHPMYGWNTNTGHGTEKHIEAIRKFGLTKHHRFKFVETALRNADKKRNNK